MLEMKKLRACAYCRVSTDAEEQEGSFELQKDYFKDMIESDPNLTLVGIYGDRGKSGRYIEKRLDFQQMIKDCEDGKIDVIYTKSVSRFARNVADLVETVQFLRSLQVVVYFEEQSLNTMDRQSELLLHILGIIAQEESRSFGENVRLGLEVRKATGHPVGRVAYGYRRIDKEAHWEIVEEEAKRIRLAFKMAASGQCYQDIMKALNEMEAEAGTDTQWGKERLRRTLHNEVYKGDVLTGKTYVVYGEKKKAKKNCGERPRYYLEGHHDPIVTPEVFDRVQSLMSLGLLHSMRYRMKPEEKAFVRDESWWEGQEALERKSVDAGMEIIMGGYVNDGRTEKNQMQ